MEISEAPDFSEQFQKNVPKFPVQLFQNTLNICDGFY